MNCDQRVLYNGPVIVSGNFQSQLARDCKTRGDPVQHTSFLCNQTARTTRSASLYSRHFSTLIIHRLIGRSEWTGSDGERASPGRKWTGDERRVPTTNSARESLSCAAFAQSQSLLERAFNESDYVKRVRSTISLSSEMLQSRILSGAGFSSTGQRKKQRPAGKPGHPD